MASGKRTVVQQCNRQFYDVLNSKKRFKVHQGGTRSGKTYAICQYLVYKLITETKPITITIVRKTMPSLKGSVLRDFKGICEDIGLWHQGEYNKTSGEFYFKDHLVEFLSVDNPSRMRGRKRNTLYCNEGNELLLEDFRQLNMRTTDEVLIDFNPSDPVHWIYNEVIPREDCDTWVTTYKDNKFLGKELIYEIERMKERDPDYWRVYGEGQRAVFSKRQVFTNWEFIPFADFPNMDNAVIGLDFGFSVDPATAVLILRKKDSMYIHELFYETGMTNYDIADKIKSLGLENNLLYFDSAEPKSGHDLRLKGILAKASTKGSGSINAGISFIKEHKVYVSSSSNNIADEYSKYWWTELKDGTIVNKPLDRFNHTMDAIRYGAYSAYGKGADFFVL